MSTTVFRADSRPPEMIETAGGFSARQPGLELDHARAVARRFVEGASPLLLPNGAAPGLVEAISASATGKISLGDMVRIAKAEKSGNAIHVSADFTEACGGYASGSDARGNKNITYKIDVPDGEYHYFKQGLKGWIDPKSGYVKSSVVADDVGAVRPVLIMDHSDPARANFIAIASHGDELTFLTPIPVGWVLQFREQGGVDWAEMPHVKAARNADEMAGYGHPYQDSAHECNSLFRQAFVAVGRADVANGKEEIVAMAAALVHSARRNGMDRIDHAIRSEDGTIFSIKGDVDNPASQRSRVESCDHSRPLDLASESRPAQIQLSDGRAHGPVR